MFCARRRLILNLENELKNIEDSFVPKMKTEIRTFLRDLDDGYEEVGDAEMMSSEINRLWEEVQNLVYKLKERINYLKSEEMNECESNLFISEPKERKVSKDPRGCLTLNEDAAELFEDQILSLNTLNHSESRIIPNGDTVDLLKKENISLNHKNHYEGRIIPNGDTVDLLKNENLSLNHKNHEGLNGDTMDQLEDQNLSLNHIDHYEGPIIMNETKMDSLEDDETTSTQDSNSRDQIQLKDSKVEMVEDETSASTQDSESQSNDDDDVQSSRSDDDDQASHSDDDDDVQSSSSDDEVVEWTPSFPFVPLRNISPFSLTTWLWGSLWKNRSS